jgi:hypothetical protein
MIFVVIVQKVAGGNVVCVDGPFTVSTSAEEHRDALNARFEDERKYKATAQVVTGP